MEKQEMDKAWFLRPGDRRPGELRPPTNRNAPLGVFDRETAIRGRNFAGAIGNSGGQVEKAAPFVTGKAMTRTDYLFLALIVAGLALGLAHVSLAWGWHKRAGLWRCGLRRRRRDRRPTPVSGFIRRAFDRVISGLSLEEAFRHGVQQSYTGRHVSARDVAAGVDGLPVRQRAGEQHRATAAQALPVATARDSGRRRPIIRCGAF